MRNRLCLRRLPRRSRIGGPRPENHCPLGGSRSDRSHRPLAAEAWRDGDRGAGHPLRRRAIRGTLKLSGTDWRLVRDGPDPSFPGRCVVVLLGQLPACKLWRRARQEVFRLLTDQGGPVGREEAGDQADLLLLSSHLLPGNPDAVGMAEL